MPQVDAGKVCRSGFPIAYELDAFKPNPTRTEADRRLVLAIDEGERLPSVVAHDEAWVGLFDGPGRREAAGFCH